MSDEQFKNILEKYKIIAMIGISSEKKGEDPKNLKRKPANIVMKYMQDFGYKVYPINPFAVGEIINGEKVCESLKSINDQIDIVDVFRPSNETPGIAKEAVEKKGNVLWLQYGIENDERYVTKSRLNKMLKHEMGLLEGRVPRKKNPEKIITTKVDISDEISYPDCEKIIKIFNLNEDTQKQAISLIKSKSESLSRGLVPNISSWKLAKPSSSESRTASHECEPIELPSSCQVGVASSVLNLSRRLFVTSCVNN